MRVLFVTHNFPGAVNSTAGSFILQLATALTAEGVDVHVIAPASNAERGPGTVQGVTVNRVPYARDMKLAYGGTMAESAMSSPASLMVFVRLIFALSRAMREAVSEAAREGRPFDVVHSHWWIPGGVAYWLARRVSRNLPPAVLTMHGSDVRLAYRKAYVHPLMRMVLRSHALVTAVSSWLAEQATAASRCAVEVGPMPVNDAIFFPDDSVQRERTVLFVGRLNAQKGIADLIQAMSFPVLRSARLIIIGNGHDEALIRERADKLGLQGRIKWLGRLANEELGALYQRAGVVAMPSREEGLGLVAVEAQLCATPVVAYNSGGLPDVVMPAHGGHLVAPGDISAFANTIASLLSDKELNRSCGESARAAMLERFSKKAVGNRYANWYRSVQKVSPREETASAAATESRTSNDSSNHSSNHSSSHAADG